MIMMWGILISVLMGLYGLMILRFMRGWRLFSRGPSLLISSRMDHEKPGLLLTVVVAARNEALRMRPLLDALAAQDFGLTYKGRWEVVWVDDESTDGSAELVEDFAREHPDLLWRVLQRDGSDAYPSHKKGAVAMGIVAAQGEWIMVTDADCVPGVGWCSTMTAA
ncbi:MAG: glycosyltransferase, partial [Bacteroidota bacterium]